VGGQGDQTVTPAGSALFTITDKCIMAVRRFHPWVFSGALSVKEAPRDLRRIVRCVIGRRCGR